MRELDAILETAIRNRATDVHISHKYAPRMRIDNALIPITGVPTPEPKVIFEQIIANKNEFERNKYQEFFQAGTDIDCSFTCASGCRVRANVFRSENGVAFSLRLIPNKRLSAGEIGLPFAVAKICKAKNGLFIVTGANGSGKTTTLAAMIDIINETRKAHILTIEDPIEYVIDSKMSLVTQREVGIHTPNFYSAIRSAVRENPDVIMLGEMRDIETTRTAIELAETGHLVFATLHTINAVSTIDRLIGQFPAGEQPQITQMVSESLVGVLAQSLLAKKTGGLIAAFELMINNPAIKNMIRDRKTAQIQNVLQTNQNTGMATMEESLLKLVEKGVVTPEEAMSKTMHNSRLLSRMLESQFIPKSMLADLS